MLPQGLLPNSVERGSEGVLTAMGGGRGWVRDAERADAVGRGPLLGGPEAGAGSRRLPQGELAHVVGGRGQQCLDAYGVAAAEARAPQAMPLLAVAEDRLDPGLAPPDALACPEG